MDVIVLIKFVADVENIPEDAWDTERGTLRRDRLEMVANPLDDRALKLGLDIRQKTGGRLVVVSMGPPQAEEICRRAIAHGADDAVLLSDRAFAGADTIATARTIAGAIRKIVADGMVRDPLVLAGMQSPDGDTAQVPVQVAAFLGFPLIPYVAAWRADDGALAFETLQPRGRRELKLKCAPALATTTKYVTNLPFYVPLERIGAAADAVVKIWSNADLGLPESVIGLAGSFTRVVRIFSPEKKNRGGYRVEFGGERNPLEELAVVVRDLGEFLRTGGSTGSAKKGGMEKSGDGPAYYRGECAVLCECENGRISDCSRELLGVSTTLAAALGKRTNALLLGDVDRNEAAALAAAGADRVFAIRAKLSEAFIPEERASAVAELARKLRPQVLLIPATLTGRVVAPLVAAKLGAGLTADCTGLEISDYAGLAGGRRTSYGKVLFQTRPALGGNIMATIVSLRGLENSSPQMATARPGVFDPITREGARAEYVEFDPAETHTPTDVVPVEGTGPLAPDDEVNLDECEVIVAVGVGIGGAANVDRLARPLVRALERAWGVKVGLACSRAAMEAGLMPYSAQVGQTGKTVKPQVYLALGISGAVQHRVGMENAGRIVAINSDADAPLLSFCDYVIRASCEEAVPVLLKLLAEN